MNEQARMQLFDFSRNRPPPCEEEDAYSVGPCAAVALSSCRKSNFLFLIQMPFLQRPHLCLLGQEKLNVEEKSLCLLFL